jgi:hypothetical protein
MKWEDQARTPRVGAQKAHRSLAFHYGRGKCAPEPGCSSRGTAYPPSAWEARKRGVFLALVPAM